MFQSTLPHGEWLKIHALNFLHLQVSIHTPTRGVTFEKSALDQKLEELQAQIVEYMTIGNVAKINATLGTISRTADSVVESFDSAKFKKENAELYNRYLKKSTRKGSLRYTMNKIW